jgi:drug/metabolite transporter (DMT)-like permease
VGYSGKAYLAMIMITILPQLFGHITYNYALRHLPATYCSVVGQLGIIIGAVLAFLFFHEVPNALQLPGSAAILMGIGLVNLGQMRSNKPLVPEPMIHAVGD